MKTLRQTSAAVAALTTACAAVAQQQTVALETSRVAIFSSGVAYFENEATVDGSAVAELKFRTEQINDIIKSMVVQDFGGGAIDVVRYASRDPLEKTLSSFGVDLTDKPSLTELLDQLRGETVEISGPRKLTGVILGVERQETAAGDTTYKVDLVNILTDSGIQQLRVSELAGVQFTNEKVATELRSALTALASANDADRKTVTLRFDGTGSRRVRVAYLLEAPIWKTTYRLVLDEEKPPFLQGWATVDNATTEDWNDVRLSLVSGRPISFRMDLYTPLYVPRPLEELELYASLRPPEYEGAQMSARGGAAGDRPIFSGGQQRARRAMPAAPAAGVEAMKGMAELSYAAADDPLSLVDAGVVAAAEGASAGELFAYTIRNPVSIPRQSSAMLPIVNQDVEASKVSIYNPMTHAKHPLNGLELKNTTDLTLMQGPITLFDGNVYAGDAKLPDMKPGEKRLVAYALDLAVEVDVAAQPTPSQVVATKISHGALITTHRYVDERLYKVRNKDDRPRVVLLEQAYGDEWKLVEPKEPYERTASLSRFRVEVPPKDAREQRVRIERTASTSVVLSSIGLDQVQLILRGREISDALRKALERVVELRTALDATARSLALAERQLQEQIEDQARVRENLKTLAENSDSHARQLKKFDEIESRIEELRAEIAKLRQTEAQQRDAVERYIASLNVQ